MLGDVGSIAISVSGAPATYAKRRLEMLKAEVAAAAVAAQQFANDPLAPTAASPFTFCGAFSLPPISEVRVVADDRAEVEFPRAADGAGWVHSETLAAAQAARELAAGLPFSSSLSSSSSSGLVRLSSTEPPADTVAEEAAWALLGAVGSALTLVHGCGLAFGGHVTQEDLLCAAGAAAVHEMRFVAPLPAALRIARGELLDQQRRDIAALASAVRWVVRSTSTSTAAGSTPTAAASRPPLSAELDFLLTKMEGGAPPTASQLVGFQAVRLRCETWMLRRCMWRAALHGRERTVDGGIGAAANTSPSPRASSLPPQTPPRSPVPIRSRDGSLGGTVAASTPPSAASPGSARHWTDQREQRGVEAIDDDCELVEMTEEEGDDDITAAPKAEPATPPRQRSGASAASHRTGRPVAMVAVPTPPTAFAPLAAAAAASPEGLSHSAKKIAALAHAPAAAAAAAPHAVTPSRRRAASAAPSPDSGSKQRSPHSGRTRGANDTWMDSRLGDLSSMQAELSRIAETRTPARDRLTAAELLNHLRARTVVN